MPLQDKFLMDFEGIEPAGHKETLLDQTGFPDFRNNARASLTENLAPNVGGDFNQVTGDIRVRGSNAPNLQVDTLLHEYGHKVFRDLETSPREEDRQVVKNFRTIFDLLDGRGMNADAKIQSAFKRGEAKNPGDGLAEAFAEAVEVSGRGDEGLNPLISQILTAVLTGQSPKNTRDLIQGRFNLQVQ